MKSHSTFSHQMITTSLKKSVRNALAKMATKRDRSFTRSIYGRADVRSELILVEQLESRVLLSGSDFGDAPDSYGTTLANDGPRHGNTKLLWSQLGADIDGEAEYDNSGASVSLSADGQTVAIGAPRNTGNGSDSGHVRIFQFIGGSWQQLGADIDGEAISDNSGWSVSLSADGQTVAIGAIFNDGNGTESGHVRIFQLSELLLGAKKDIETDGQPTAAADGDDLNGLDDDDGIVFTSPLIAGQQATIDVITTGTGPLAWWVDFDSSGTFDASERFEATILSSGTHSLTFDVPETAVAGNTYARFRFASQADDVSLPTGKASNGEVEDYAILLSPSTNVVTNLLDSGHGSLRQAVLYSNHAPSLSSGYLSVAT